MRFRGFLLLALLLASCQSAPSPVASTSTSPALPSPLNSPEEPVQQPVSTEPVTLVAPTEPAVPEIAPSETPAPTPSALTVGPVTELPKPEKYRWVPVIKGLDNPVGLENAGDGSGRLFIIEQDGRILIWKDGSLLEQPFLDIRDRVGSNGSEQGLLGLAFHPRYAENGYFFVNYTDKNGDTHIARFSVTPANPDLADAGSEKFLIFVQQPYPNHNGGSTVFGPDGYLYLGLGDGGAGGDPQGNGQSTETLLGKILRINVDSGDPYAIPADNPFDSGGGLPEIWAYGLRNPWRFSFDSLTGDIYIGDVGQNKYEEIDYLPAGSTPGVNFGWDYREGRHRFEGVYVGNDLVEPVAEYDHSQGCSVTGGGVYRGANLPEWEGVYIYGDYCSGNVWGLLHRPDGTWQDALLYETGTHVSSFGVDEGREVYLVDYSGNVFRLSQ